jgi:hypothetical protein
VPARRPGEEPPLPRLPPRLQRPARRSSTPRPPQLQPRPRQRQRRPTATASGEKPAPRRRPGSGSAAATPPATPAAATRTAPQARAPTAPSSPRTRASTCPSSAASAYYLFWVILAAGVLFLIYVIVRNSSRDKADDRGPSRSPPRPSRTRPAAARPERAARPRRRGPARAGPRRRQRRRLHPGDPHAHAALLHRLDHDGLIRVAPFRTNGDYVRDLKPQPDLRSPSATSSATSSRSSSAPPRPRRRPLRPRVQARRPDRHPPRRHPRPPRRQLPAVLHPHRAAEAYPFDLSPSGARAVIELAAHDGRHPSHHRPRRSTPSSRSTTRTAPWSSSTTPPSTPPNVASTCSPGPPTATTSSRRPRPARRAACPLQVQVPPGHVLKVSPAEPRLSATSTLVTPTPPTSTAAARAGDCCSTREDGQPYAIKLRPRLPRRRHHRVRRRPPVHQRRPDARRQPRFLDPTFLTDLGPARRRHRRQLLDLGADSPAETISNTRLTPSILQLLALLVLLLPVARRPLRPPRATRPSRSRRHFAEHVEALGQQYARARASRHALRLYATWALDRLRDKTLTSRQPGLYALAQAIAGRTGDDENQGHADPRRVQLPPRRRHPR